MASVIDENQWKRHGLRRQVVEVATRTTQIDDQAKRWNNEGYN